MATVTMDIVELDKLRQTLKETQEKQEALNAELKDVKGDKRVIIKRKPITGNDFTYNFDYRRMDRDRMTGRTTGRTDSWAIAQYVEVHPIINHNEEHEFINFEDAKRELAAQMEEKYREELADLRHTKKMLDDRMKEKEREGVESQRKLIKEHQEDEELHAEEIAQWKRKYSELESGKKELSRIEELTEIVQNLERKLVEEQSKPWWKKLFNK